MFECCIVHCRNYAGMPPLFLHQRIYIKSIAYLLYQSTEHEEDACQHPGLDSGESLRLGSVGGDGVEDVDQHQEQSDQETHSPRDDIHWNQERYPGHYHKQAYNTIILLIMCYVADGTF